MIRGSIIPVKEYKTIEGPAGLIDSRLNSAIRDGWAVEKTKILRGVATKASTREPNPTIVVILSRHRTEN